ncbi:unnamed protein product (macronuclear) [Paramecium tetraurelia]|uniref:Uncharacterized protein n=1 Tax=Paramecium tetraurelia TaxID=5888 RepID=A0D3L4_PARTE|nr:uncharacterized protein GSPATT00013119001 [Paramecium tetraurelia]CAK77631.1 unnamed protein product [Paramecium tetraurelia]|eukprot:XP_001445028.1 hypothetical protein (macronuclear) [Paramecium tetraurelia strain d4-2]
MKSFIQCYSKEKIQQVDKLGQQLEEQNQKLFKDKSTVDSIKFDLDSIQIKIINQFYEKAQEMEKQFSQIDQTYVISLLFYLGIIIALRIETKGSAQVK